MSLHFVSSAVLTSSDGISHNEEQVSESAELASVRARAGDGFQKPLFEQLQKNMDDKQSLNDDKYKETFSGTRGLDDEVSERSERACLLEDLNTRDGSCEMAADIMATSTTKLTLFHSILLTRFARFALAS